MRYTFAPWQVAEEIHGKSCCRYAATFNAETGEYAFQILIVMVLCGAGVQNLMRPPSGCGKYKQRDTIALCHTGKSR